VGATRDRDAIQGAHPAWTPVGVIAAASAAVEDRELCGALGVDACELGTPILAEELANRETR
jgi:hypothetical protein